MSAKLINGKKISAKILAEIKQKTAKLNKKPGLAAILIGENSASRLYLNLKEKACKQTNIDFHSYYLEKDCTEKQVFEVINFLNNDHDINGIIVQLPLPKKFNTNKIIKAIDPNKDIDGFHPQSKYVSPNDLGIIELLKSTKIDLKNKKITILSNSKIFAKPFKKLLADSNISTNDLKSDILIVAIGKPHHIKPKMIKKDAILIDVGINKVKGKTLGDIDPQCDKIAAWRSPVPGGVGPMTIAMLLTNLIKNVK